MFYVIIVTLAWLVWHIGFRIKVIGKENLIKDRGFVMVCNHISAIDPVFLVISRLWGKKLLIMAKQEVFEVNPVFSWMFRHVGVFPVARGKGDAEPLNRAIETIQTENRGLLIFPEGTRSKDGNLQRLKSGAFVVAQQANVDIQPCRIIYKGGKMRVFGRATVVFGKPIPIESLNIDGSASSLRSAKAVVTQAMEQLLEDNREYC
ncbi:MAG: lysophospholipid acyltransferase family protein [Oscillospiraceae bacterium]|nr:lysophospholipid acyltransferase family protein [Oscillospiraceae bacterium]